MLSFREYRRIEEDYRLMRFETAGIGEMGKHIAPEVLMLTQLRELIRYARTPASEGLSQVDLEWMRKVAHRYPYPPSLLRYSLALGLNGKVSEAREHLLILRALHGDKQYEEAIQGLQGLVERYPQLCAVIE